MRTRFRGITEREGVLWRGAAGWTEFSPFLDYDDEVASRWLSGALADAAAPYPAPVRDAVPVNCTVPAVGPDRAAEIVRDSGGCRTAKVKVAEPGQSLTDDCDRVAAVRDALGADGKIRVDANAHWDVEQAIDALAKIDAAAGGLEYAEQPCPTVDDLAAVRRRTHVPIAADESIRRAEDPLLVQRKEAADVAVVKVQPLGGVQAAWELAAQLELPLVVSSALETSVGIAASVTFAAALPELPYACGLNTVRLLTDDATTRSLVAHNGQIAVPAARPDADRAAAVAADDATRQRWLDRLQRAGELLK
ncbi:o-succinylbenzoate synthase [Epidermidibacterium keratini]|uniref:O-succinylbenzoate synthase n=1 Tax=Epidermidibacterium keratini TaxID=1891644 RepID=A0A7L4YTQ2_9ACTN|nr:o-succinylbenzoate synthase [Epidermidibacterium keratini]